MSRQDHRDYDAALEKIRREAEAVMVPKRERRRKRDRAVTFILALAGIGLALVGITWAAFCWCVCLLFLADWIGNHEGLVGWTPSKVRITQVTIVLGGIILGAGPVYHQWRIEKASTMDGKLIAQKSFPDVKSGTYVIETGPGLRWVPDIANHEPFSILGDKLRVDFECGQLFFSTVVRDRVGNLIAKVDKNNWQVVPDESFDKNYSSDALEVLDKRGRVVLQVQLLTNGLRIGGEWYDEQGGSFRIAAGGLPAVNDPKFHDNSAIPRWFNYRSKDHWAEWAIKMP